MYVYSTCTCMKKYILFFQNLSVLKWRTFGTPIPYCREGTPDESSTSVIYSGSGMHAETRSKAVDKNMLTRSQLSISTFKVHANHHIWQWGNGDKTTVKFTLFLRLYNIFLQFTEIVTTGMERYGMENCAAFKTILIGLTGLT